jgi:hypothetical protein
MGLSAVSLLLVSFSCTLLLQAGAGVGGMQGAKTGVIGIAPASRNQFFLNPSLPLSYIIF